MIELKNVEFEYLSRDSRTRIRALDNINLSIRPGEYVAILGRNGSGKSTMVKLINGILFPSRGEVIVEGMNTRNKELIWKIRKKVGLVLQNPENQIVASIVEDDVAFAPENLGLPRKEIEKRVEESLKIVDMLEYRKWMTSRLSGGQKQRLAIASLLAMRPDYMIFDESTDMLDPVGRSEVMKVITKLNKEHGIAIIFITHFMEEALKANRILFLDRGRIITDSSPHDILRQPDFFTRNNIEPPPLTSLVLELRKEGIDIPVEYTSIEEIVQYLCA